MPIWVQNGVGAGACLAGLEGAGGVVLGDSATLAGAALVDAGDRYISAGQQLPSLLGLGSHFSPAAVIPSPQSLNIQLRNYQADFAAEMMDRHRLGQDRGLLVLPTGAGKTVAVAETLRRLVVEWNEAQNFGRLMSPNGSATRGWLPANWRHIGHFHRRLQRPSGILFVAHRDFLLRQAQQALGDIFGAEAIGIVQGNILELDRPVVIASAQTLIGILDQIPPNQFGLVVLDEAHHYVPGNRWSDILKHFGFLSEVGAIAGNWPKLLIGMTATPDRLTGSPLLHVYGPEGLVSALDAADLWDRPDRVILKPEVIEVSLNIPVNDVSGESLGKLSAEFFYEKLNRGDQFHHALVYVNTTSQVPEVAAALNDFGISAEGLIGETPRIEREEILDRFAVGITRVLVNVGVAGEGFDVPSVETVVLAFESESRTRVVQAIGRAMRVDPASPGKRALVVDLGGNTRRHRLNIQIRESYEAEGTRLKGASNGNGNGGLRQRPEAEAEVGDIAEITFQGEKPATRFIEEAFAALKLSASGIEKAAYRLGVPSDILFAYTNGLRVPPSLTEVFNIAREVGDQNGLLHDAWAKEKTAQMETVDPLPADLGPAGRAWARHLRWGLWHKYEGVVTRVSNATAEGVRNWLRGKFEGSREIWEETLQRQLHHFTVPKRKEESLRLLNEYLAEKGYPLFEPWMENGDRKSILIDRLKQLTRKLGRSPTIIEVDSEPGMAGSSTYTRIFGSFNNALEAAGLPTRKSGETVR